MAKFYVVPKGARHAYAAIVHTGTCSLLPRMRNAHEWTRNPLDEGGYSNYRPCSFCRPEASPGVIAKQKTVLAKQIKAGEQAKTQQQAAHKERVDRMGRLFIHLQTRTFGPDDNLLPEAEVITVYFEGHKFQIREIDEG